MQGWVLSFAVSLILSLAPAYRARIDERALADQQRNPTLLARKLDAAWHKLALWLAERAHERWKLLQSELAEEGKQVTSAPVEETEHEEELATSGAYGKLPEVHVDIGIGATFPLPIQPPARFSWAKSALRAASVLQALSKISRALEQSRADTLDRRLASYQKFSAAFGHVHQEFSLLAQEIRYLESWVSQLERQWLKEQERGKIPLAYLVAQIPSRPAHLLNEEVREIFRPHRVMKRAFLPERLAEFRGKQIELPIATDIADPKFIAEIDGALDTHWNQSPWARSMGISFRIRWSSVSRNTAFARGKIDLLEHLKTFPEKLAIITTGGLTTYVKDRALILGPGKITPRTLAHELGHLLGFEDCYLRTLSAQGVFGLAVLEWNNPLYPDDLMCDNSVGVVRAVAW